jgi:hypothetical protein
MKVDQARHLKDLERENGRLKRAVANLTLDKLILEEAAKGNFWAPSVDAGVWCMYVSDWGLVAACTLHFCGTSTSERWGWLSAYLM